MIRENRVGEKEREYCLVEGKPHEEVRRVKWKIVEQKEKEPCVRFRGPKGGITQTVRGKNPCTGKQLTRR